jgi:hypothetical protein
VRSNAVYNADNRAPRYTLALTTMRLAPGLLVLGALSTSLALPNLKPFRGALTSWIDPFGQLPLPKLGSEKETLRTEGSIFDVISNDESFTKLAKAIKFADGIETILKDSASA